jgi:hypothetical protein
MQEAIAKGGTRAAAKRGRAGGGSGSGGGRRGQRPGGVPEEVRRAILEGPPRTMLVTSREDRTQIAVLEDRSVVEHYVTRNDDVTYVGNIYMARVQNVLPGMEAAFLDIGKGRNGVLYAGEVLYDELDLEEGADERIENALKSGQKVLVQVTKDPMGSKGPRLTMHLSLAGRFMVLAPNSDLFGISRKLTDKERDRLRRIVKQVKPDHHGVIVRTAAEGATEEQITADVERLLAKWARVEERSRGRQGADRGVRGAAAGREGDPGQLRPGVRAVHRRRRGPLPPGARVPGRGRAGAARQGRAVRRADRRRPCAGRRCAGLGERRSRRTPRPAPTGPPTPRRRRGRRAAAADDAGADAADDQSGPPTGEAEDVEDGPGDAGDGRRRRRVGGRRPGAGRPGRGRERRKELPRCSSPTTSPSSCARPPAARCGCPPVGTSSSRPPRR